MEIKRVVLPDEEFVRILFELASMKCEKLNEDFFKDNHNILLVAYLEEIPCGFYMHIY